MASDRERTVAYVGVALVAVVAAVVSFDHFRMVAEMAGEQWRSWLYPLSADGMLAASSLAAWQAKRDGRRVSRMTVLAITVGLVISVAANVGAAVLTPETVPAVVPPLIAAWPPVALALAFEQVLRLRAERRASAPADQQVSASVPAVSAPVSARVPVVPEPPAAAETTAPMLSVVPVQVPAGDDSRDAAKRFAHSALDRGEPVSGAALGMRFGKSDRWGRGVLAEVKEERAA